MYTPADYYLTDELLSDEHKIIRSAIRDWVNRSVKPIIEQAAQNHIFPKHLVKEMGEIGAFGPYIPEKYGGAGLDQMAYGIIMTELERGDSAIRSAASVQSSLVM
ncbi:MAG: acyl-CoA dehydrogenase family protein, partial [Bacteroidales bacterium]|nr:acyl-CoA dehydrogenase family protein [Bacteroidales bacterium]